MSLGSHCLPDHGHQKVDHHGVLLKIHTLQQPDTDGQPGGKTSKTEETPLPTWQKDGHTIEKK